MTISIKPDFIDAIGLTEYVEQAIRNIETLKQRSLDA